MLPNLKIIDEKLFLRAQEIAQERNVEPREVPYTTRGQSLVVGNIYCGSCGSRMTLATSGRNYQAKNGTVTTKAYSYYRCWNRIKLHEKCEGQATYSVEKLDNLVDQIVRIQLSQIQKRYFGIPVCFQLQKITFTRNSLLAQSERFSTFLESLL